jgi:sugar phosphate isomerase/epimerase
MRLAIQEDMLHGRTMRDKFQLARDAGFDGIEFWAKDIGSQMDEAMDALMHVGLAASGINFGRHGSILDADLLERERGLELLRQALMDSGDLGAAGVGFVPAFFGTRIPDLSPYATASQLKDELLIAHVRTLEDFANAMGQTLFIEPVNRYETDYLNALGDAARVAARRNHPRVKIVADLFHMALEEDDMAAALRQHGAYIGCVHAADHNRHLPGHGFTPFAAAADALKEVGFDGWVSFECGTPGENHTRAVEYARQLAASVKFMRDAGF